MSQPGAAQAQLSGPNLPDPRQPTPGPSALLGRRKRPGGTDLSHRKEPKAREIEGCGFRRETCLYPGFLIHDFLTSKDFFINKIILLII